MGLGVGAFGVGAADAGRASAADAISNAASVIPNRRAMCAPLDGSNEIERW
jgi:hypothetical protein